MHSLGILGVGELTEKVVMGLRRSGFDGAILLSPRNAQRAEALAHTQGCQVLPSNQAVVDQAELVMLGVRPAALAQIASEVRLRRGQRLLSLAAGVGLAQLQAVLRGATQPGHRGGLPAGRAYRAGPGRAGQPGGAAG